MAESSPDIVSRKKIVRAEVRARLTSLDGPLIERKSQSLAELLFSTSWWSLGEWIFIYIPMGGEVDTRYIVSRAYREKKQVAIPRMQGEDLAFYVYDGRTENLLPNQFGILEPDPTWKLIDPFAPTGRRLLILTPGLAFDRQRRRLGRGKGFYDRFLHGLRGAHPPGSSSWAVGLCFAEQLVESVPVSDYDEVLEGIVTDREVIR
ncbi:MAG: 5-formyltetrahydrofolate cyclo-ligase [Spirochaetaceae bacterium]|nr:MAG: 5-formyltetrahydrofolate cyclo-ligase [Spirochaetaceae bacterium]